ncbi:hypothetical protein B0T16DRAFT_495500 [Cercophora newfieldiana]|uniref:Uncharacterized protein n=1 Tax=Cercophora newfieldiana TaxID=92897 RepID=A0AA39XVL7_9PEZI|nr:hypothetical protein B0T16DRAFT_495500 [Cercophora newfieldiana]
MARITYPPSLGQSLKGRVVVITGGAQGIGASIVEHLHSLGAHVIFGDIADVPGTELASSLSTAHFVHTDVTSYADQLALFESAFTHHGSIDAAVQPSTTPPGSPVLPLTRSPVSRWHLSRPPPPFPESSTEEKFVPSVTFTSVYSTTKHGLVGLMRSLPHTKGLARFNVVCPSATDTGMLPDFVKAAWTGAGFRMQSPEAVAESVVHCISDAGLDRRALVVAGGKAWESEGELEKLSGAWLGEENGKEVDGSAAFYFASVSD